METIGLITVTLLGFILLVVGVGYLLSIFYAVRGGWKASDYIDTFLLALTFLAISFWCGYSVLKHLAIIT